MTVSPEDSASSATLYDRVEVALLGLGGLFVFVNYVALTIARSESPYRNGVSFLVWVLCAVVGQRLLARRLPNRDRLLFPLVLFISGWGLLTIDRLAPDFADRQTIWLLISTIALIFVAISPNTLLWLRNFRYLWLFTGLALLISTILLGQNPSGQSGAPQLWLGFSNIFFQPSEALKIILIVFLSSYLAEQFPALRMQELVGENRLVTLSPRIFGPILLMWGISIVMLVWQRDLGAATLFFVGFLALLYVAARQPIILIIGAILIIVAGAAAYHLFDVVRLRIDIWINPWIDADGAAFQLVQSLQAFSAGGIGGQGIAQGSPTYIPVVHSDFVFAAIAEEWGFLGVIVLVCATAVIVSRGMGIAVEQNGKPFRALLAVGMSALLGLQSIMIMGGAIRLLPLTGVTLPFVSYGGSSLMASFIMVGLLIKLSASKD